MTYDIMPLVQTFSDKEDTMSEAPREIKLNRVCNNLSSRETYVARLAQRYTLSYDEVLDEVMGRGFLNITKPTLKMILEHTLETMIANTLRDGNSRRLGDYFMLQLEVKGRFDSPDEQFDDKRNKLALKIRPLKAMKRKPGRDDLRVYNRNAGPKASIGRIYSASAPDKDTLVFGDDIVLEGENLFLLDDVADVQDSLTVGYYTQRLRGPIVCSVSGGSEMVSDSGRRITIPWGPTVGQSIKTNWGRANPEENAPLAVMVALRSRGGVPTAKLQIHRARAFFDTWLEKFPDATFDGRSWGGL